MRREVRGMGSRAKGSRGNCGDELEMFGNAGLLQNRICCMTGKNFVIDGESPIRQGAVPDFVVTAPFAFKLASMFAQDFFQARSEAGHQEAAATTPLSSCW